VLVVGVGLLVGGCGSARQAAPASTTVPSTTLTATTGPADTETSSPGVGSTAQPSPSASHPCGTTPTSDGYRHVVWIIMENRGYDDVVGSLSAPYLASVARACGLAANYSGVAHPSLPNYIALTSGSTHGIGDDNGPSSHPVQGPSIFSLLGSGWRSLEESMPTGCDGTSTGEYAVKHNPAAYYTNLGSACAAQDLPLGSTPDLTAPFTLITPNLCHDMHDCSTAIGDAWLAHEVPLILDSAIYRAGSTAVFITWDENDSGGTTVPTYVIAPSVPAGTRSGADFTHYSLLRTTEELLGLHPLLGGAATANSMTPAFNL
jgi:hypothetical protein